ncbi:glycoside hydrolase family 71 protein [Laccaria bicolor S238N-H82]|uniref:Glycoside hydrolase family 71 protein n=1 Tax=Laccaria bicolor (strain S238N-H82 / ATCC MYA-4686) TaxID=486041 RepID=B0CVN0_LACBS|nr:glycoside hydrolase family 71 protein [Laccaria bicolor S238N-H82]EDR13362.1 glycoside hydrolase family 71 protein [Laccaria bicolor S238N-H82]|eukprot:XP_001875860.1 glycoside hydrolase family 71 protein [Laccaria bicolor S238N-H82]
MQLTTVLLFAFVLTLANASTIPLRRIRISSLPHQRGHLSMHRRHARFLPRQVTNTSTTTLATAGTATPQPLITTTNTNSSSAAPSPSSAPSPSISIDSTPQPSQPPADNSGAQKYVVAHHMIGNTFPYTIQDWADDIALAHASGIDGFALNMGSDDWEPARVADAYQAALQSGLDFKLFLSLDMSVLPCGSPADAQALRNLVKAHITHPNQFQYKGRAFVSTFAGETCQFGQGSVADGWKTQFTRSPDLQGQIYFVPAFFIDPATFGNFADVMDGDFNWNSGWPIQVTTSFAQNLANSLPANTTSGAGGILGSVINTAGSLATAGLNRLQLAVSQFIGATTTDEQHLAALSKLPANLGTRDTDPSSPLYMAAVSPWFFTHYGKDSFNKNFIFLSDQHLYSKRWESLVETRDTVDVVEVLTWNDYGESHYVGPIKGSQPNSQAWTDGMNHTAWLGLTQYYATAFKTGSYPAIEKDQIYMWSRPHSSSAQAPDPVGQPDNFQLPQDAIWAVVLTTAPSSVTLATSPTTSTTVNVPAGLTKLTMPISAGGTMKGTITRNGQTVVELNPTGFTFQGSPKTYNFNAFVASATAD